MARAHINFEDRADGTFDVRVVFAGGWDKTSHAHQYANLLMNELDKKAERQEDPKVNEEVEQERGEGWVAATPSLE